LSLCGDLDVDPVVATGLLDRPAPIYAAVVQIEGASCRLREHAYLLPEHIRSKEFIHPLSLWRWTVDIGLFGATPLAAR
jgi:hypothetical protein